MSDSVRRSRFRLVSFAVLIAFAVLAALHAPQSALAKSASYTSFDVDLTVGNDGTYHVEETQTVNFVDGPFSQGHRDIPLVRTGGIDNVAVYEIVDGQRVPYTESSGSAANTFTTVTTATEIEISWNFESAASETRTFVVAYDMKDALRLYPGATPPNQQVWFTPIGSALTKETPVDSATFTVHMPRRVDAASIIATANDQEISDHNSLTGDNETFTFTHGKFSGGDSWEIRLQSNIVATDATVPAWQPADDQQREQTQKQDDRNTRIAGFAGLGAAALLVFGGLGIGLLWYTRGRDPNSGLVATFIPEPPDDTPPAVVGVLLDEKAQDRDIVSTFTDLGNRGVITIAEERAQRHFTLIGDTEKLCPFEKELIRTVFSGQSKSVTMGSAAQAIRSNTAHLKEALYQEVVDRGFFFSSPEETRTNWRRRATVVTSLSILAGIAGSYLYSPWLLLPAGIVTFLSIVLRLIARALPKRTEKGAEEAAKWRAFERYLKNLENYDTIETAQKNFNRYLPYAIAFGLETTWVARFYASGISTPNWMQPTTIGDMVGDVVVNLPRGHRRGGWSGGPVIIGNPNPSGGNGGGGVDLPDVKMPDLQKTSDSAARGLTSASKSGVDILNVIGAIFEIASLFGGGGGKGGSSGGGGGGFN